MRKIKFIWVGKLRKGHWKDAAEHYMTALSRHYPVTEVIVKDAPSHLAETSKNDWEGERILEKLEPQDFPVALDEHGKTMTSVALADRLTGWAEDPSTWPCFIIGGAYGLSSAVLERCRFTMSLSPMTFPHELARVLLLEQLYRAASIQKGLPYHHV
ncbi:23S rRNA (pseudouridine1915-N3)-methyltransferase [Desulfobaculum xiamenense]|uniref:Ribosomal RNA large subunit methyltransferase H n=1 Tax=Desulfobaculum xiamenense TaxID=995050 RepID=A0A846QMK3_9BACT|nr:23S rRNA (pseudouridine(1915)-N(3))-methyltransferase RlmH [Desulfobaculum xiamenense]NJB69368.1 23S rRNA (pseudouridine1915-N3)-methyltransferase [Desulfobaculum xiamenense]